MSKNCHSYCFRLDKLHDDRNASHTSTTVAVLPFSQSLDSSPDQLFRPTSGRWLWNEEQQLAQHTVSFDIPALKAAAATAVGIRSEVQLSKLAEGASNKVYIASGRGQNGLQRVVVKVPDKSVRPSLVTASEVATLEYIRTQLELPVPKVFKWSAVQGLRCSHVNHRQID
jgi:hypothetical protein